MEMDIRIHKPYVIIKDRPYSSQKLEINLGEITINCEELWDDKRFFNALEKKILLTKYIIDAKDLGITYIDE